MRAQRALWLVGQACSHQAIAQPFRHQLAGLGLCENAVAASLSSRSQCEACRAQLADHGSLVSVTNQLRKFSAPALEAAKDPAATAKDGEVAPAGGAPSSSPAAADDPAVLQGKQLGAGAQRDLLIGRTGSQSRAASCALHQRWRLHAERAPLGHRWLCCRGLHMQLI